MRKVDTGAYSPTASGDAADAAANGAAPATATVDSAEPLANGRDAGSSKSASAGAQGGGCAALTWSAVVTAENQHFSRNGLSFLLDQG